MPKSEQISEAEARVMDVLWIQSPLSAQDVIKRLEQRGVQWNAQTIKTLLGRLLRKGALEYQQQGRRYLYSPLISREHYAQSLSSHLLERLFGGKVTPLVASFVQQGSLADSDIAALKALVSKLDEKDAAEKP